MGYRFEGKQKLLSFGAYPAVSLKDARQRRDAARELLAKGIDPREEKNRQGSQARQGAGSARHLRVRGARVVRQVRADAFRKTRQEIAPLSGDHPFSGHRRHTLHSA